MEKKLYEFTLVLKGVEELSEDLENNLFESGCDDAILYFRDRIAYLNFHREAISLEEAIFTAIREVESISDPEVKVAGVEPGDFVTGAEIARRLKRSKESVRLLISGERGSGNFPVPVAGVTSSTKIWRWSEVSKWFHETKGEENKEEVKAAYTIREFNESLAVRESPESYGRVGELMKNLSLGKK